ncbi:neutral phospholipase A2 3-like [Montipora foliosa]|uniref:neutral phospholipase A2 3-like n=1 Tax=Montipora foliosa TaxID=591990 RepID=UPI0035F13EDE
MPSISFGKIVLLLAFMAGCCLSELTEENDGASWRREKRNLLQFAAMIRCATKRSWLAYYGYGCWCGKGGSGNPVDATDICCMIHDKCYDRATAKGCRPYSDWYSRSGCTRCASDNDSCEKSICECDGAAACCFRRSIYNAKYKRHRYRHSC